MDPSRIFAAFIAPAGAVTANIIPTITTASELIIQAILAVCAVFALFNRTRKK